MLVQLLHRGVLAPEHETYRKWLEPGVPIGLGGDCELVYLSHRDEQGDYEPELTLTRGGGAVFRYGFDQGPIDARPLAAFCLIPRAIETHPDRPGRLLLELVALRRRMAG